MSEVDAECRQSVEATTTPTALTDGLRRGGARATSAFVLMLSCMGGLIWSTFAPPEWAGTVALLSTTGIAVATGLIVLATVQSFRATQHILEQIREEASAASSRFESERVQWATEEKRLQAEYQRYISDAEAVLASSSESELPVADPAELVERLRVYDADVTADVGRDGSVTVVLRRRPSRTVSEVRERSVRGSQE